MRGRITLLVVVAVIAAVAGVGFAQSDEGPSQAVPGLNVEEVYVAGPDGNALKCNGKLVKVRRSELGAMTPPLMPEQAVAQRRVGKIEKMKVGRCGAGGVVWVDAATP